ncbi:MAG TPA: universal stress protein [Puia sp.]|nr:universal stress protein [Puia sp.]
MRNIIVTVDFTENSINAARYAADMAAFIGAELHLVHVLDYKAIHPDVPIPDYVLDEVRDKGFTDLDKLAAELKARSRQKVCVATDLESGPVERQVREFCQWKQPFLVVRGASRGERPEITRLPYPLLTIPPNAVFRQVRNIVIACDAEEINNGMPVPLEFLARLRDLFHTHFEVLHVASRHEETATISFREWRATLTEKFPEIHFVNAGSVDEGISEYLDHHTVDWLMVFPKKDGPFRIHKSISEKVVLHCPVPVMSIKE